MMEEPGYRGTITAPMCIECNDAWLERSERWRLYLTDDDPPEPVFYCESCAEREFGR